MLLSVMALTLLGAGLSMQPDAFLPCTLKILSVPVQQIIKVHVIFKLTESNSVLQSSQDDARCFSGSGPYRCPGNKPQQMRMTAIHTSRTQGVNDNTEDSGAGPFIFYLSVLKRPPAISSKRKSSICKQFIEE